MDDRLSSEIYGPTNEPCVHGTISQTTTNSGGDDQFLYNQQMPYNGQSLLDKIDTFPQDKWSTMNISSSLISPLISSFSSCKTTVTMSANQFIWEINGWSGIEKLSYTNALPLKNRIYSSSFGLSDEGGVWHFGLYPIIRERLKNFGLYLFSENSETLVVGLQVFLLDENSRKIEGSGISLKNKVFDQRNNSWGWHNFFKEDIPDFENVCVFEDVMRIKAELKIFNTIVNNEHQYFQLMDGNDLMADVKLFLDSKIPHDINVECFDHIIKNTDNVTDKIQLSRNSDSTRIFTASRFMLGARSPVLRSMLFGDFKERYSQSIKILDVPSKTMENMLLYIHTDTLLLDKSTIQDLAELFLAADTYNIVALKNKIENILTDLITYDNALEVFNLIGNRDAPLLLLAINRSLKHHPNLCGLIQSIQINGTR